MDYIDLLFIKLGAADRFFFNAMISEWLMQLEWLKRCNSKGCLHP